MRTQSLIQKSVVAASVLGVAFFVSASSHAAALTWNPATNLAGASDGAGVWDSLETNWWDGVNATNWMSATPDSATFGAGGAAGVVTLGEPISVGDITFGPVSAGNYQITGSTLTLANPSQVTGTNATISSALAGNTLRLSGGNVLTLDGAGSAFTTLTVAGGSTVAFAGGASAVIGGLNLGDNNLASGNGAATVGGSAAVSVSGSLLLGNPGGNSGTMTQSGGRVDYLPVNTSFRIGHWPTESSTYTLSGGTLSSTGSTVYVGWDGNGTLNQSAGTTTVFGLKFGGGDNDTHNGASVFNLTGGRVEIGAGGLGARAGFHTLYMGGARLAALANWSSPGAFNLTGTNGPLVIDSGANAVRFTGAWSGTGGFVKQGAGSATLAANNIAKGTANVGQGEVVITNGAWNGPVVVSNGATVRAIGGAGLLGAYYNIAPPNPHPSFATLPLLNQYLAGVNPNLLFGSAGAGANFDFGGGGLNFPPGYNLGVNLSVNFQARWIGKYNAPTSGTYVFATASDDGSMIWIDGTNVVNNNFSQGVTARSNSVGLAAGLHDIVIGFYQGGGGLGMMASNTIPGSYTGLLQNALLSSGPGIGSLSGEAGGVLEVSNGLLTVAQSAAGSYSGSIIGNGGLFKIGTAALTLHGSATHTDEAVVGSGALVVHSTGFESPVRVQIAGTLTGTGRLNNVTMEAGGLIQPGTVGGAGQLTVTNLLTGTAGATNVFDFTAATNDILAVPGTLQANGATVALNPQAALANGNYLIGTYGTLGSAFNTSVRNLNVPVGGLKRLSLNYATPNEVRLTVADPVALKWSGAVNGTWDVNTTTNWINGSPAPDLFVNGDAVLFDDTAVGNFAITTFQSLEPSAVVVSNDANAYTITGTNPLANVVGGIWKYGTNSLTLSVPNSTFTGGVLVAGGRVIFGATGAGSFGQTTGVTIEAGAQVNLNGVAQAAHNYMYRIAGNGPDGRGAIFNTNANIGTSSTVKWLHLTTNASIGAAGTLTNDNARFDVALGGGIAGNGFTLTKVGNNVIVMRGSATNLQTVVAEGMVYVETVNDALGTNAIVQAGAYLGAYGARTIPTPITLNGGTLSSRGAGGVCTWTGPISLPVNSFISTLPPVYGLVTEAINVHGSIAGAGGLTIYGNNTTAFRGTNSYTGNTIVNNAGGTLLLATANGNSIVSPTLQVGHLADGGGIAVVQAGANDQFGPNVNMTLGGSPNDWTYLKLMGTEQRLQTITSDDNGGGVLESTENEAGITTDGVLNIVGSGNSYWSGTFMRDRAGTNSPASKLRINKSGSGTLALATGNSPSPMFSGGIIVSNGTLNLKTRWAAGTAPIRMVGGTLALDGAGLAEGSVGTGGAIGTTSNNPVNTAVKLSTPRANRTTDFGGNTTWIYSGYLAVTSATPVTYTFAENIDDVSWLQIDGAQVLNDGTWNNPTHGTITLAPGLHKFDARFYNGGGGAGPVASGWWTSTAFGFGLDKLGRAQATFTNYTPVTDAGDGMLLISEVTVTNDIVLEADVSLRVSNLIGPTNSISGPLSESGGTFGITKVGAGALKLDGVNTYGGSTAVNEGTLFVNNLIASANTLTVASNATLGGTGFVNSATTVLGGGTVGSKRNGYIGTLQVQNLTLDDSARAACQLNGATPTLNVLGTLTTTGTNFVEIHSSLGPVTVGTYALIQYAGGSIAGGGFGALALAQPLPNGAQGYLTDNGSLIELVVTNVGSGIRWIGAAGNAWDVGISSHWNFRDSGVPTTFSDDVAVLFDDLAVGNFTSVVAQTVRPLSVLVSNNTAAFTFGASAYGITGTTTLVKQGTNRLTIATGANRYTGGTFVDAGSIVLGAARPFGFTTGITVNAGAQVNLNGVSQAGISYNWTIAGDGPGGSGALFNTNAALNANSSVLNLTLAGNATIAIHGPGNTDVGRTDVGLGGTINGNGFQITKTGLSQLNLRGITAGLTNILVSQGIVIGENVSESLGSNLWVASGAQVAGYGGVTNSATIQLNGGTLSTWGGAPSTWNGEITLLANSFINNFPGVTGYGNVDVIVNGRITGPGALTKLATNTTAILTAANDFGGPLVVNAGTLLVSGANAWSNSTTVQNGGTLRITNGNDRLPVTTALTVNGSDTTASLFDLNGFNQAVASLSGTNTYGATVSLGGGTLTISGSGSGDYFGKILGSGGLVRSGTGVLVLNNGSNTYAGGTTVNGGTLAIRHHDAAGIGAVTMNGGTLSLDASGLWEGRVTGAFNIVSANPKWAANLTTEKANSVVNTVYPDYTTYIYSGWLNITNTTPVTWSFVKRFDDSGLLVIDGVTLINQTGWDQTIVATATLSPGTHRFEVRMGEGIGGIGPTGGWPFGFGVDTLGRNQATITNFVQLSDLGDGQLYRRDDLTFTNDILVTAAAFISAPVSNTTVTLSSQMSGPGGLTKTGSGLLVATGTNALNDGMNVAEGGLFVNGEFSGTGLMTVAGGAQLWGSGSMANYVRAFDGSIIGAKAGVTNAGLTLSISSLQLDAGAVIGGFLNGTNPTIRVATSGGLFVSASNLVSIVTAGPMAVGTYPLIAYNTSIGSNGFSGLVLGQLPNGAQGYLSDNGVDMVELVITNAGGGLQWYGSTGSGVWDVNNSPHWAALPANVAVLFQQFDAVRFDDTATNFNVNIVAPVTTTALNVSNETQNFTFSGFGIGGTAALTKDGAAKVTFSNANSFTGSTLINGGTVAIVADSALGAVPGAFTPAHLKISGGTLEALTNITLAGNRGLSVGPAIGTGAGTVAVVSGATLTVNSVITNTPGGTGEFIKTGLGTLVIGPAARHTGGTTVNEGTLQLNTGNNTAGTLAGGSNLTINSGGRVLGNVTDALGYYNGGSPTSITINGTGILTINPGLRYSMDQVLNMVGGVMTSQGGGDGSGCTYTLRNSRGAIYNFTSTTGGIPAVISANGIGLHGEFSLSTVFNVADGAGAVDLLVSGNLRDCFAAGGLTKAGDGVMVLSGTNAYTLPTIVSAGTLVVGNGISGSLGANTGTITVDGTLAYNLPGTTTVANVIGGTGTLVQAGIGLLVLNAANILSGPAIVSNGTLLVNGSLAGSAEVRNGATLGGTGTIAGVTSEGTVAPGSSAGQLIVTGNYDANTNATLAIELGGTTAGTDHDQLVAGTTATLDGALNVTLINAYTPAHGDSFQILVSGSVNGTFATTNLPALTGSNIWAVTYNANDVTLSITNSPSSPPTGYNAFSNDFVLVNGPEGDDDNDGFANLLEYVTGANPTNTDTIARVLAARTNGTFALKFTRTTNSVDTTLIVEGANSAANNAAWIGFATNINGIWGVTNVTETGGPDPVNVTVFDVEPAATNRFLRLRVTRP